MKSICGHQILKKKTEKRLMNYKYVTIRKKYWYSLFKPGIKVAYEHSKPTIFYILIKVA